MPYDPDEEPDLDALFEAGLETGDWLAEFERWRRWHSELAGRAGYTSEPFSLHVPDWHNREEEGARKFGWYSDHEWAKTVWPNPKYL